jgi:hypothetical protein
MSTVKFGKVCLSVKFLLRDEGLRTDTIVVRYGSSGSRHHFLGHLIRIFVFPVRLAFDFGQWSATRELLMRSCLSLIILGCMFSSGLAFGDGAASPKPGPVPVAAPADQPVGAQAAASEPPKTDEAKLLSAVREAMERNAQEIKALKEQYAKDMQEQHKRVAAQQAQIETLQRSARLLEDRLKAQASIPSVPGGPNAPGGQNAPAGKDVQDQDRQQKLNDIQQKQLKVLQEQLGLVVDEVDKQAPSVQKLQTQAATQEARAKQAAERDKQLSDALGSLLDSVDSQQRNPTWLPNGLHELFLPSGTNVTPFSIWNSVSTRFDLYPNQRGAGQFAFEEWSPYLFVQLNKRILLSGQFAVTPAGAFLGQSQVDLFINDWLTADIGHFLAPIGFWNEALDPVWINKLPDVPLTMRQVIPDGLTVTGLQLRGAKYLFGSPIKMGYAVFASNGLGVPDSGSVNAWANNGNVIGTTSNVNSAMAYGARLSFWVPTRGINFGVSEFVNAPYSSKSGAYYSIWQPYFNYHRGNWDFRFEYGNSYENTKAFIGNNQQREGLYAQVAYRNYNSLNQHLQRLEFVGRFSNAFIHGVNLTAQQLAAFSPLQNAPVDGNQYTIGINYYLYASTILKFAYEINSDLHTNLHDNVFMMQFATNF